MKRYEVRLCILNYYCMIKKEEGCREGRQEERAVLIKTLMESMNLSIENAMTALKIPPAQWEYYKKQILS